MRIRKSRRGMVLVFALWVLGILTILAVSVAAGYARRFSWSPALMSAAAWIIFWKQR